MNILILTPYLPYPLNSGGAQGVFNMVNNLRHKHHFTMLINEGPTNREKERQQLQALWPEVDIIYYPFWRQLLSPKFLYEKTRRIILRKLFPNSHRCLIETALRPYGEWFSHDHVSFVNRLIKDKDIDMVQVEFYESLPWSNHLPTDVKKIFIHHELAYVRHERLLSGVILSKQEKKMLDKSKEKEFADLEHYDAVVTVTDIDKHKLQDDGLKTPLYVSTLAIHTASHEYADNGIVLTSIGGYNHLPNKEGMDWFCQNVSPLLQGQDITLNIIGTSWPSSYSENSHINISLKGFVEDLTSTALGTIMIVPILTGSGMRMKILEAAAMSLPIITTSVGVEGLDFVHNESCIIADTPESFANAILSVISNPALRKTLGENANRVFQQRYSPAVLAEKRNDIYDAIIHNV